MAQYQQLDEDHPWWTVLRDYANADSAVTIKLWRAQEVELHRRGLWKIYQERRKMPGVTHAMERRGVTFSTDRADELTNEFLELSKANRATCVAIANQRGYPRLTATPIDDRRSISLACYGPSLAESWPTLRE